jgi:hypothetical protein
MRNIWYPKKIAGYVTIAKLQTLGKKDAAVERDPTFGSRKERESIKKAQKPRTPTVKRNTSAPVRAPVLEESPIIETGPIAIEPLTVRSTQSCGTTWATLLTPSSARRSNRHHGQPSAAEHRILPDPYSPPTTHAATITFNTTWTCAVQSSRSSGCRARGKGSSV